MHADVPTLMAAIVLASLTIAGVMVVVGWGGRREGLRLWASGLAVNAVGHVFFALRVQLGTDLSILGGNSLSSLALSLLLAAVMGFHGVRLRWTVLLAPPVLLLATLPFLLDDYSARVVACSVVLAAQSIAVAAVLFARKRQTVGRGMWLVMAGMGLEALTMVVRAVMAARGDLKGDQLLDPGWMQTATFLGTFAVLLITSLGFVFMTKERADEANRQLAAIDPLTGAANRRSIIEALHRDVGRAIRTREPLALMMIDLDHFKSVNDAYGHLAGDVVLRNLTALVRQRIRSQDIVGRYGGEEFLVVLPDTTLAGVQRLAQDLCNAVAVSTVVHGRHRIRMTVSIGAFGGRLENGDSWDLLIHCADSALYRAKDAGRNRVEVTPDMAPIRRNHDANSGLETFPPSMA